MTAPFYPKCVICVAPHTSNWDFILGKLTSGALGLQAGFLMKEQWFVWPLGPIFRAIGGIAVPRGRKHESVTDAVIRRFDASETLRIAVTPEGTRSHTSRWRTGFLRIAAGAHVPILLGAIDYPSKTIIINDNFEPSGDMEADLRRVKNYYKPFRGKFPEKFCTDDQ